MSELGMRVYKYFHIGASFWIRSKGNTETARLVAVTEISVNPKGNMVSIGLGTRVFTPEELMENYEWSDKDNDWGSFGRQ